MEIKDINQKRSDLRLAIVRLLVAFENETDLEISSVKLKRDEEEQWEVDVRVEIGD